MGLFVVYLRVSTQKQGAEGLGMEAQRSAVEAYVRQVQGEVLEEFVEVESGKKSDRPQLAAALVLCRRKKATLLIAKLDRLARSVAFISSLMETGVPFVAADCPHDDRMMLQIRAVFAEEEARKISIRTKAALAVVSARGVKLGCPCPEKGSAVGVAALKAGADQRAANILPLIENIRQAGTSSLKGIARELNDRGVPTSRGGDWTATAVKRVLARS